MKLNKLIILILIVFFKTETLLSNNDLFSVNNILVEKKGKVSNNALADKAIKKGFDQLISKILLENDKNKVLNLNFNSIKQLVSYYRTSNVSDENKNKSEELVSFSVTFDKNKIHNLFYERGISYSEISDKEIYVLPVLIKDNEIFIFNNNYFYEKWNNISKNDLVEFILYLENIEVIQKINQNKNTLINLNVNDLFKEYSKKNSALILIEDNETDNKKVYIKANIQNKTISKSFNIRSQNLDTQKYYEKIINETKKELINLVKSRSLIDIRTPSFLITKFILNKKSSLVELKSRINSIDLIDSIYVQEFNKDYMKLRIKYLGKLENIINQLKKENVDLKLIKDNWIIKVL
tara:strand:- start:785 stop:1837 length:1053 start_codon:yes stop_codon:yes gene_type:complete